MITKTRTNFLQTVSIDNVSEKDLNNMQWNLLEINRPIAYYKLTHNDIQRPDLIALKVYGTMQYWWVLMKFNDIDDVWNDIVEGDVIKCPHILDIENYFAVAKSYT